MIKILFFIEELTGGGAEVVLRNLVNHMDQAEFDITVQTVWPCEASRYLVPGIHYKSIYDSKSRISRLRYRIEAETGLAYRLHIKDDYDIECAYLEMGATKTMAASTNSRAKKLAWVHCDLSQKVSDPKAFVLKTTPWYSKYDVVVCVSQSVKERFDELFNMQFNTTVLYNVIDDVTIWDKAQMPLPKRIKKGGFIVLSIGRLVDQKNHMRLLKAHKRLLDDGLYHDLWILGEGPRRSMLENYIMENNLQDSVWMPGFIENPYPFIHHADLLACSSNYEGYSTFLTEGVILGKAILTTDVSGARELLGDSEYGLIVDNDDEAFYQGMKELLMDKERRVQYSIAASLRSQDFSAYVLAEKTEVFFEELMVQ